MALMQYYKSLDSADYQMLSHKDRDVSEVMDYG